MQYTVRQGLVALVSLAVLAGCTTNPFTGEQQISKTAIGGAIGAATGAAIGAIADKEHRGRGAAIGAGVGVLTGGAVGAYMDYQEKKLREKLQGTGVSVKRVGNDIYLNMPGNLTFATDHAEIRSDFFDVLDSVVLVVNEYTQPLIEIDGHSDTTGTDSHNQVLSEQRANSVAAYFRSRQVVPQRLVTEGFGERFPIASNDTVDGRQENRRVELRLVPLTQG